jgi:hypothetical protein
LRTLHSFNLDKRIFTHEMNAVLVYWIYKKNKKIEKINMYKLYIDLLLIVWKKSSADFREIFLPLIANETSRSSYRSISLDSQHLCVCVCFIWNPFGLDHIFLSLILWCSDVHRPLWMWSYTILLFRFLLLISLLLGRIHMENKRALGWQVHAPLVSRACCS